MEDVRQGFVFSTIRKVPSTRSALSSGAGDNPYCHKFISVLNYVQWNFSLAQTN